MLPTPLVALRAATGPRPAPTADTAGLTKRIDDAEQCCVQMHATMTHLARTALVQHAALRDAADRIDALERILAAAVELVQRDIIRSGAAGGAARRLDVVDAPPPAAPGGAIRAPPAAPAAPPGGAPDGSGAPLAKRAGSTDAGGERKRTRQK
jgi:hypothetical protein